MQEVIDQALDQSGLLPEGLMRKSRTEILQTFEWPQLAGINLWNKATRTRNVWKELLLMPYPRHDNLDSRLVRWDLLKFFDSPKPTVYCSIPEIVPVLPSPGMISCWVIFGAGVIKAASWNMGTGSLSQLFGHVWARI